MSKTINFPAVGKQKHGKGPRTKKARRRLAGLDAQQRAAEKDARRVRSEQRKTLFG